MKRVRSGFDGFAIDGMLRLPRRGRVEVSVGFHRVGSEEDSPNLSLTSGWTSLSEGAQSSGGGGSDTAGGGGGNDDDDDDDDDDNITTTENQQHIPTCDTIPFRSGWKVKRNTHARTQQQETFSAV